MISTYIDATGDSRIDSLLAGVVWGSRPGDPITLSYSFPSGSAYWSRGYVEADAGWYSLNNLQQQAYRQALALYAEVANLTFTAVADGVSYGELRVAYSYAITGDTAAIAYSPASGTLYYKSIDPSEQAGDIWINPLVSDLQPGSLGFETLLHEMGHALGLKHPFEAGRLSSTLSSADDHTGNTVMSYTSFLGAGYQFEATSASQYQYYSTPASTPMLYDILALQYLYGANMATRAGDDSYQFATQGALQTLWDGGGSDTLDLRNQTIGARVDMRAGQSSSIGWQQLSYTGDKAAALNNVSIAFGVSIENLLGSVFDDQIIANAASNQIEGGLGDDSVQFTGLRNYWAISENQDGYTVQAGDASQTDLLMGIEWLIFDDVKLSPERAIELESQQQSSYRLYAALLGREPDTEGLQYWVNDLSQGNSLINIAQAFTESTEYQSRFGAQSNTAFIDQLYLNILQRQSDASGYDYWLAEINQTGNRGGMIISFSESAEYQQQMEQPIASFLPLISLDGYIL